MGINSREDDTILAGEWGERRERTGEWFSRYHNKRRQINAFGLESNQHYSDNSPPANTHLTLLGLILSTARTTTFLSVRQSSLNVFLYPRAMLLRAAAATHGHLARSLNSTSG